MRIKRAEGTNRSASSAASYLNVSRSQMREKAFAKVDADSSGSLSSDELDTGMKSLMPAPSSTVQFGLSPTRSG